MNVIVYIDAINHTWKVFRGPGKIMEFDLENHLWTLFYKFGFMFETVGVHWCCCIKSISTVSVEIISVSNPKYYSPYSSGCTAYHWLDYNSMAEFLANVPCSCEDLANAPCLCEGVANALCSCERLSKVFCTCQGLANAPCSCEWFCLSCASTEVCSTSQYCHTLLKKYSKRILLFSAVTEIFFSPFFGEVWTVSHYSFFPDFPRFALMKVKWAFGYPYFLIFFKLWVYRGGPKISRLL